jgi:hypothetical protein
VSHARITAVTSMIKNGMGKVPGLLAVLALVPDPRRPRGRRYGLVFVLAVAAACTPFFSISPSSTARLYRQRSAEIRFSAACVPPRLLRRGTAFALTYATSCLTSDGVGSSRRRSPHCSTVRFQ